MGEDTLCVMAGVVERIPNMSLSGSEARGPKQISGDGSSLINSNAG
uniref:Uncharacterized protein n=1 Tax=Setaria digitata TaxID=48799 RepID=A0A915PTJ2_9BILA